MKKRKMSFEMRRSLAGYGFISPWIIGLLAFFTIPIVESFLYSFQHVSIVPGGLDRPFAGLTYYKQAFFGDDKFIPYLISSFKDMLLEVPIILIFSIFIAVLLNQAFPGRGLVRSVFFLPLMLSSTVLLSIIRGDAVSQGISDSSSMYMVTSASMEDILLQVGIPSNVITYLTQIIDRIFDMTWQSGVQILLFLSSLQSIPRSLSEAAGVEGATQWEYFWKIIVPMISPIILVNIVYTIIDTFTSYSNGLMRYITSETAQLRYSYSSALTWVYFVCIMAFLGLVVGLISRKVFYMNE